MKNRKTIFLSFVVLIFLLLLTIFISANSGSIKATFSEMFFGLFNNKFENVNAIVDLRFPRIIIALLVGASLAVSGLLLQTVIKNPLIDPSIIGVSSGANLFLYLGLYLLPSFINYKEIFSIIGGIVGFLIIYLLASKTKSNVTIILLGIAISTFFSGILNFINYLQSSNGNNLKAKANLGMKSWDDVRLLLLWLPIFLIISFLLARVCNVFVLSDEVITSLGKDVHFIRLLVSLVAVILASVATSVAGVVVFLALITPHIAKIIIGKNHIVTTPFTALLGAFVFLLFDTVGRVVFQPIEIPADIIMMIIGAPVFVLLIKRGLRDG